MRLICRILKNLITGFRSVHCRRKQRLMHLCETLSLGERRSLALVEVEGQKFLVGSAANSVSLVARLLSPPEAPESCSRVETDDIFEAEEYTKWR